MKSPFTGGLATPKTEKIEITFREKTFIVESSFYVCNETGLEFAIAEQYDLTLKKVCDLYVDKFHIKINQN